MAVQSVSLPAALAWSLLVVPLLIGHVAGARRPCEQQVRSRKPVIDSFQWSGYCVPLMIILGGCCGLAWCILFITYDVGQRAEKDLPRISSKEEHAAVTTLGDQRESIKTLFRVESKSLNVGIPDSPENQVLSNWTGTHSLLENNAVSERLAPSSQLENYVSGVSTRSPSRLENKAASEKVGSFSHLVRKVSGTVTQSPSWMEKNVIQEKVGSPSQLDNKVSGNRIGSFSQLENEVMNKGNVAPSLFGEIEALLPSQADEQNSSTLWAFVEKELENLLLKLRLLRTTKPTLPGEDAPNPPSEDVPKPLAEERPAAPAETSPSTSAEESRSLPAETPPSAPAEESPSPLRMLGSHPFMNFIFCEIPRSSSPTRGRGRGRKRGCGRGGGSCSSPAVSTPFRALQARNAGPGWGAHGRDPRSSAPVLQKTLDEALPVSLHYYLPRPEARRPLQKGLSIPVGLEVDSSLGWVLASFVAWVEQSAPERWASSGAALEPSEASEASARGPAAGRAVSSPSGVSPSNGLQGPQDLPPRTAAHPESSKPQGAPAAAGRAQGPGLPVGRSISGSSTCSSLAGSSQDSDEVFSDAEEKSPLEKRRVLRKTKSWKTFFTMVHWSLRRRSSWVQLAGHEGNFKPSEGGQILKRFSAVEDACLSQLMSDVLRPFVPTYHGVVDVGGECYIQMDDLLRGLDTPSIMDCKMGTRTYLEDELCQAQQRATARRDLYQKMVKIDPQAPTALEHCQGAVTKARYMQWREGISSSASLGFRIEGITIEGGAVQKDFKQIRGQEEIVDIFLTFTKSRLDVLSTYLARLKSMHKALEESTFFKTHEVIGSSLLFLHDRKGQASVWMIDFGKTLPSPANCLLHHDVAWTHGNHEDGYLIGLQHLIDTVQVTLHKAALVPAHC
ncbi:uncharacterized protein LOC134412392 [Elgaria multicarinata webbii]|uniref:uncharacterized protein LOC134412392 n=1 Tax=Elgaria multicarinata webbii TaxID=159646 RepID=UPI002FCD56F7